MSQKDATVLFLAQQQHVFSGFFFDDSLGKQAPEK